ncbi:MAG: SRPBCC family protein [Gammaproteobacteria bacterium]|nr:SRPBCC family protein [Gammaproteobacteria bacterium]
MVCLPGALAVLGVVSSLHASEVKQLDVEHHDGIYKITMTFSVAAPLSPVRAMLTDYAHLSALNSAIVESEVLPPTDQNATRVRTRTKDCILFLCADITRVEDVTSDGAGGFRATIVPGLSDMKSGLARWRFQSKKQVTRIRFEARMEPDFWIPPLIGPLLIKHRLRTHLEETADNLERLAAPGH